MRGFILKIALFLLPLVLLSYFMDRALNQVKRSVTHAQGEYPVWNDLYTGQANAEIMVYGSSRALAHIDPQLLSDSLGKTAYNLGVDGHNFRLQELRHRILLRAGEAPKMILHSLDMFTLEKKSDLYNADQFLPYLLCNTEVWNFIHDYTGYQFPDQWLPLLRYYGKTEAILQALKCSVSGPESEAPHRTKGFQAEDKTWNDDLAKARKKMSAYRVRPDQNTIAAFRAYLSACAAKGISVVLVYSPEYDEGRDFVSNRDSIMHVFKELSQMHAIRFLDYSRDSMCLDKRWFYNSSHLNREGSRLFTQKLIRDLKRDSN